MAKIKFILLLACTVLADITAAINLSTDTSLSSKFNNGNASFSIHNTTAVSKKPTSVENILSDMNLDKPEWTEEEKKQWLKNKTEEIFKRPLTREQYNKRNWMWLRCRTHRGLKFDMGGIWFGQDGSLLKEMLKERTLISKWRFKYVNDDGWGDAMVEWVWVLTNYSQRTAVDVMYNLGVRVGKKYKRAFYMWDCPGFEHYENWGTEREGMSWPVPGQNPAGPLSPNPDNPLYPHIRPETPPERPG